MATQKKSSGKPVASTQKKPAAPTPATKKKGADASGVNTEALTAFISRITKAGVQGDLTKKVEFLSTGNWIIDRLLGDGSGTGGPGGIPRQQIVEIFGDESCGKTTLALMIAKGVQDAGGLVLYVDHERTLQVQARYVQMLGINITDPKKWILIEPESYEQGNSLMAEAIVKLKPALVVVDSLAAAVPQEAMDKDPADAMRMGMHAAITAQFLARAPKLLKVGNTAMVILNQLRVRIKKDKFDHGPDEQTTGGNAIKFYMCARIEMKKKKVDRLEGISNLTGAKEYSVTNQQVKVVIVKNKIDIPFRSAHIHIKFGKGIDGLHSLIELGMNRKIIKGEGWYSYDSPVNKAYSWKLQGFDKVYKYLTDHPEVVADMLPLLLPKVDTAEMQEAIASGLVDGEDLDAEAIERISKAAETESEGELDEESIAMLEELKSSQAKAVAAVKKNIAEAE